MDELYTYSTVAGLTQYYALRALGAQYLVHFEVKLCDQALWGATVLLVLATVLLV